MMQSSPNELSDDAQEGLPTTPWELRDIIEREIEVLGPHCDLNHIDVSQMTSLADVFFRSDFNGDISLWDTSRVASLENTFAGSRFNGDLSRWDTSNVTNMAGAFQNTVFTGDLSTWDTRNVHNMNRMFKSSLFDGDLWTWDVSCVFTMDRMFESSRFNRDIADWNVSCLASAERMFAESLFTGSIARWNMRHAKNVAGMFNKSAFSGDLSCWTLPENAKTRNLVSPGFQGVLPQHPGFGDPHPRYAKMLGSHAHLNAYLLQVPLNAVHAELLLYHSSQDCPEWLVAEDFARLKEMREMAHNLNYNLMGARELFVSMLKTPDPPSLDIPSDMFTGPN